MITWAGFFGGLVMIGIGFLMIWKTYSWKQNVGSLYIILGYPRAQWLDWKFLGIVLMVIGLVVALGLFQTFIALTLGRLFGFLGG